MTRVCSRKVTHQATEGRIDDAVISHGPPEALAGGQVVGGTRIVMTTLSLPEGNAFGVDETAGGTPIVNYAENRPKRCSSCGSLYPSTNGSFLASAEA
jgi:hypothetical protein